MTWIDFAKGLSIILVVNLHTTLGIEKAIGATSTMHYAVIFAETFRMPMFFMVAGLFLHRSLSKPLVEFIDKKVLHFAYFYLLWVLIQMSMKEMPQLGFDIGAILSTFAKHMTHPLGTLWFIYMLPIYFVSVRILKTVPKEIVWGAGLTLSLLPIHSQWHVLNLFAEHWVYFLTGAFAHSFFFKLAKWADMPELKIKLISFMMIGVFTVLNIMWVVKPEIAQTQQSEIIHKLAIVSLSFMALIAGTLFSVLMSKYNWARPIITCGHKSIVIYLAFFLFMASSRTVALKLGLGEYASALALMITFIAIVGPLIMEKITKKLGINFLFERPEWTHINPKKGHPKLTPFHQHV